MPFVELYEFAPRDKSDRQGENLYVRLIFFYAESTALIWLKFGVEIE